MDAVVFSEVNLKATVLLIQRKNPPFQNMWALPGGFVDENEDIDDAAGRELFEETNLKVTNLKQVGAYGKPNRDPRHHTVSIAYFGFADASAEAKAGDDAKSCEWFEVANLPEMAFDHHQIIIDAMSCAKIKAV